MSDALNKVLLATFSSPYISSWYLQDLLAGVSGHHDSGRFWGDQFSQGVLCGAVALLLIAFLLRALHRLIQRIGEECPELECPPRTR